MSSRAESKVEAPREACKALPAPFRESRYRLLQEGVWDSSETRVYLDDAGEFAFLHPCRETDYARYEPRVAALGLAEYKRSLAGLTRRFEKLRDDLGGAASVLEIGSGDGAFLGLVGTECPGAALASLELDRSTGSARDAVPRLQQFASFAERQEEGVRFDRVCAFHVLEHVLDPELFLSEAASCLTEGGKLILEVPSLADPLLSLYDCEAYRRFYFQRQHPYVYSEGSIARLLDSAGFALERAIHHQRYGLENHLHWLSTGSPGGSESAQRALAACDGDYRADLEGGGRADSFIAVARPRC